MENPSSSSAAPSPVKVVDSAPVAAPSSANVPASSPASVTTAPSPAQSYASFGRRLGALLLDQLILSSIAIIIMVPLSFGIMALGIVTSPDEVNLNALVITTVGQLLLVLVITGYWIVLTGKKGQTIGKMILGIKVVRLDNGEVPGYGGAFLREIIGKFISGIIFDLGYLWVLWDPKKEAWHDKIAKTIVIKL